MLEINSNKELFKIAFLASNNHKSCDGIKTFK